MVDLGWIGAVTAISFDVDVRADRKAWPWLVASPELDLLIHSIHYLDAVRSILGNPVRVFAAGGPSSVGRNRDGEHLEVPKRRGRTREG